MPSQSSYATAENCQFYAQFMSGLSRGAAEGIYWSFFLVVLILLFATSWKYERALEKIDGLRLDSRERRRILRSCFRYCLSWAIVGFIMVFFEAFVLMSLQFCDGEPIMSLYWSTWTMLQIGGVIAILGIVLHVSHMVKGRKHPPWGLALGTPVLVVAGLAHLFQGKVKRKTQSIKESRSRSRSRHRGNCTCGAERSRAPSISSATPTIRGNSEDRNADARDNGNTSGSDYEGTRGRSGRQSRRASVVDMSGDGEYNARVMGYTKDGDVIICLAPSVQEDLSTKTRAVSITWDDQQSRPGTVESNKEKVPALPDLPAPSSPFSKETS